MTRFVKRIFVIGVILLFSGLLSAHSWFQTFFEGKLTKIHPVILHDQIYLPLGEVAGLFHLKADVDLHAQRIILEPETEQASRPEEPQKPEAPIILGEAASNLGEGVEKPLIHVKIKIFKANEKYSEEEDRRAIEEWILTGDSFYTDTHGEISETSTGIEGHFAFQSLPPGDYELVATYAVSPTELYYWWIPIEIKAGAPAKFELNLDEAKRLSLKR